MREPDWKALPANTPQDVRRLIERCLRNIRDNGYTISAMFAYC